MAMLRCPHHTFAPSSHPLIVASCTVYKQHMQVQKVPILHFHGVRTSDLQDPLRTGYFDGLSVWCHSLHEGQRIPVHVLQC